tara:strand:- start:18 stop:362 length:345 start_codon:yes stop_codon:yes gene_type:complete
MKGDARDDVFSGQYKTKKSKARFFAEQRARQILIDKGAASLGSEPWEVALTVSVLIREYQQARPYIEEYYLTLAKAMYEDGLAKAFILNPGRVDLLKYYALVDKDTGEIHDINA